MNRYALRSSTKRNILICEQYIERLEFYQGAVTLLQLIALYRAVDFGGTEDDAKAVCSFWFREQVMPPNFSVELDDLP